MCAYIISYLKKSDETYHWEGSFKATSLFKLPLDPRHDTGLDLVIIHAL
jgi:hypothetical protein